MVSARVEFESAQGRQELEFDSVSIETDDGWVHVLFSSTDDRRMRVSLSSKEVKSLLNWRLLMSL